MHILHRHRHFARLDGHVGVARQAVALHPLRNQLFGVVGLRLHAHHVGAHVGNAAGNGNERHAAAIAHGQGAQLRAAAAEIEVDFLHPARQRRGGAGVVQPPIAIESCRTVGERGGCRRHVDARAHVAGIQHRVGALDRAREVVYARDHVGVLAGVRDAAGDVVVIGIEHLHLVVGALLQQEAVVRDEHLRALRHQRNAFHGYVHRGHAGRFVHVAFVCQILGLHLVIGIHHTLARSVGVGVVAQARHPVAVLPDVRDGAGSVPRFLAVFVVAHLQRGGVVAPVHQRRVVGG